MRIRLALLLVRWSTSLAGWCVCDPCRREREIDAQMRRIGRTLTRAERRAIHRGAWGVGQHPR